MHQASPGARFSPGMPGPPGPQGSPGIKVGFIDFSEYNIISIQ